MQEQDYTKGIFVEELKSRFLCHVLVNGEILLCYVPSSCKLNKLVNIAGNTVLLTKNTKASTRTQYTLAAVKHHNRYIPLYLSRINDIIFEELQNPCFSLLGSREAVQREVVLQNYRCDLFVEDTNTLIEIKCVLNFGAEAQFPNMPSKRAIKQLETISSLLDRGYNACYMIVSLSPFVNRIAINQDISEYYSNFSECVRKGMIVLGCSIQMNETKTAVKEIVPVIT